VNLAVAINVLIAILGIHVAGSIVFSPHEEKGKEAIMPELPFVVGRQHQPSTLQRAQIIRVVDVSTGFPIKDASVKVRMRRSSTIIFKQGHTNAQGLFVFTYEKAREWSPISVYVDAAGYWGVNDETWLADERVITLFRRTETIRGESEREKALLIEMERYGRLLSWPT
jgi:hypothetical protein